MMKIAILLITLFCSSASWGQTSAQQTNAARFDHEKSKVDYHTYFQSESMYDDGTPTTGQFVKLGEIDIGMFTDGVGILAVEKIFGDYTSKQTVAYLAERYSADITPLLIPSDQEFARKVTETESKISNLNQELNTAQAKATELQNSSPKRIEAMTKDRALNTDYNRWSNNVKQSNRLVTVKSSQLNQARNDLEQFKMKFENAKQSYLLEKVFPAKRFVTTEVANEKEAINNLLTKFEKLRVGKRWVRGIECLFVIDFTVHTVTVLRGEYAHNIFPLITLTHYGWNKLLEKVVSHD